MKKEKKKLTNGPNDARCVVWARSRRHRPLKPSSSHRNLDRSKKIELVRKNKRKNLLMAQTTQDASFGPILVNAAHPSPPHLVKLTNGPNDVRHVVWAWSRRRRPLKPSSCCQKKRGNGANSHMYNICKNFLLRKCETQVLHSSYKCIYMVKYSGYLLYSEVSGFVRYLSWFQPVVVGF